MTTEKHGNLHPACCTLAGEQHQPCARAHAVHAHTQHRGTAPRVNGESLCAKNPREACNERAGAGTEVI